MKTILKIVKYLSVAFAIYIVVSIISLIFYGVSSFFGDDVTLKELKNIDISSNITSLDIDINACNLNLKTDTIFKVETNSKHIKLKENSSKLEIEESRFAINKNSNCVVNISVPSDIILESIEFDAGAGSVDVSDISTGNLSLDLGAGRVYIDNLSVEFKTDIDGGAGEINIKDSNINNLDLDMGIGKISFDGILLGTNKIDAGIGEVDFNLLNALDNYTVKVNKGIGNVVVNNQGAKDGTIFGFGSNEIFVSGGIGNIDISFR